MRAIKVTGALFASVLALGAAAATSASAVEGPFWLSAKDTCALVTGNGTSLQGWLAAGDCENLNLGRKEVLPNLVKGWEPVSLNSPSLLLAGEETEILDLSLTNFILESAAANITCTHIDSSGILFGGDPGTGTAHVVFLNCTVNSFESTCHVWSKGQPLGQALLNLKNELVYLENEHNENIGELFTPAVAGPFVTLQINGTC